MSKSAQLIGEIARFVASATNYFEHRSNIDCIDGKIVANMEHKLFSAACIAQENLFSLIKAMHEEEIERVNVALDKAFGK